MLGVLDRAGLGTARMHTRHGVARFISALTLCLSLGSAAPAAFALNDLSDEELSRESGAGLAFVLEDFRYQAAPTSYVELIGGPAPVGTSFRRADVRYYGLTLSSWNGGNYWDTGNTYPACTASTPGGDLSCPMSTSGVAKFAPHDNPYVLRVFDYTGVGWDGTAVSTNQTRTVLEFLGPSNMHSFRWGFWGEIEVNQGGACPGGASVAAVGCRLQSQTLIWGKPTAPDNPANIVADLKNDAAGQKTNNYEGSALRLFQNSASADNSLGLTYHSRLSGDFRFSVNQQAVGTEAVGNVPRFSTSEGLFFRNVTAYLPLGQLHYQSIVLDDVAAAPGNFVIELTRVPNDNDAYDDFYSLVTTGCATGPGATTAANNCGYVRTGRSARYYETHGYSLWGRSGTTNNTGTTGATGTRTTDTTDGIFFYKGDSSAQFTASASRPAINTSCATGDTGSGCAPSGTPVSYTYNNLNSVNIGDARITGLLVQHLKITTCSAGATSPC